MLPVTLLLYAFGYVVPRVPNSSLSLSTSPRRFALNFVKFRVSRCSHAARNRAYPSTRANPLPFTKLQWEIGGSLRPVRPRHVPYSSFRKKEKLLRAERMFFSVFGLYELNSCHRYFLLVSKAKQRIRIEKEDRKCWCKKWRCQRRDINTGRITVKLIAITRQDLLRRYFSEYENVI